MAQYDVHALRRSGRYVLDCQSDLVDEFETRFVVPLLPMGETPRPLPRLAPVFTVDGRDLLMATQYAAAIPKRELGPRVASLAERHFEIDRALEMLLHGT